jgi:hypothetical protein
LPFDGSLRNNDGAVKGMLKRRNFEGGEQAVFDEYYHRYALAEWSLVKNVSKLVTFRQRLVRDLRNYRGGSVYEHFRSLVLGFMGDVANNKNLHPAVRVNAMLMIGELNAVESPTITVAPQPFPPALPVLVSAAEDPQQLDVVKVAALVGILRHGKLGGIKTAENIEAVSGAALAVAGSQRPPGRSADGHAWLRKLAAEVLGELGAAGENGEVANALAAMVAEAASPFYARCTAAEALGKLNYAGAAGLDASKLAARLGRLAVDAYTAEAKAQAEAEEKAKADLNAPPGLGGFPGPRGFPGLGGQYGDQPGVEPAKEIPIVFRNRLKGRVHAASVGLSGTEEKPGGVASLAEGTPDVQFIATVQKHVQAILTLINKTRTADVKEVTPEEQEKLKAMMADIKPVADQLRAALSKPAASTPPASPAPNP